jgi:hypothetical protein
MRGTGLEMEVEICVRMCMLYRNFYCVFSCYLPPN